MTEAKFDLAKIETETNATTSKETKQFAEEQCSQIEEFEMSNETASMPYNDETNPADSTGNDSSKEQNKTRYFHVPTSRLINETLYKLKKTCYWSLSKGVPEQNVAESLYTILSEFSMKYGYVEIPEFHIGDIVSCNYGYHIPGEINGNHVHSIVCEITGDSVYLVPIIKYIKFLGYSKSYIEVDVSKDVQYYESFPENGIALLDKGRYVRSKRITSVVGKCSYEFFSKVITQLATSTFDFRKNIKKYRKKEDIFE